MERAYGGVVGRLIESAGGQRGCLALAGCQAGENPTSLTGGELEVLALVAQGAAPTGPRSASNGQGAVSAHLPCPQLVPSGKERCSRSVRACGMRVSGAGSSWLRWSRRRRCVNAICARLKRNGLMSCRPAATARRSCAATRPTWISTLTRSSTSTSAALRSPRASRSNSLHQSEDAGDRFAGCGRRQQRQRSRSV